MTEQDCKLLEYVQSQPYKRINKFLLLATFSKSIPATGARIDELVKKNHLRRTSCDVFITPQGEKAIEDYRYEEPQKEQPPKEVVEEQPQKNWHLFGVPQKEVITSFCFPLAIALFTILMSYLFLRP